ncbi:hypothetical protein QL285_047088 [Trifolium repens]|nr:hypothetical protein QL285_047088 [Trifolium repens]
MVVALLRSLCFATLLPRTFPSRTLLPRSFIPTLLLLSSPPLQHDEQYSSDLAETDAKIQGLPGQNANASKWTMEEVYITYTVRRRFDEKRDLHNLCDREAIAHVHEEITRRPNLRSLFESRSNKLA